MNIIAPTDNIAAKYGKGFFLFRIAAKANTHNKSAVAAEAERIVALMTKCTASEVPSTTALRVKMLAMQQAAKATAAAYHAGTFAHAISLILFANACPFCILLLLLRPILRFNIYNHTSDTRERLCKPLHNLAIYRSANNDQIRVTTIHFFY